MSRVLQYELPFPAYSVRSGFDSAPHPATLDPGDPVTYRHCEGDRPATYLGRHGSRHLITIPAHGSRGNGLRYVDEAGFHFNGTPPHE